MSERIIVSTSNTDTNSLLIKAVESGDVRDVYAYLINGADPNTFDEYGNTMLCKAIDMMDYKKIYALLHHRADPNIISHGETSLHLATRTRQKEVMELLLCSGAFVDNKNKYGLTALHIAVLIDKSFVELLLNKCAYTDEACEKGFTPLHIACSNNLLDVVNVLLLHDAQINLRNKSGHTPVYMASYHGYLAIVKFLLKQEDQICDVNIPNNIGQTALMASIHNGHLDIAEFLIKHGHADVNCSDDDGITALMLAVDKKYADIVNLLCLCGVQIDPMDKTKNTALTCACTIGDLDIVKILAGYGAIEYIDPSNVSPISIATYFGHFEVVEFLLEKGLDPDIMNNMDTFSSLHISIRKRNHKIAKLLLDKGADINKIASGFGAPIHIAIEKNDIEMVKFLITEGADIEIFDEVHGTPLQKALFMGRNEIRKLLKASKQITIDSGVNITKEELSKVLEPVFANIDEIQVLQNYYQSLQSIHDTLKDEHEKLKKSYDFITDKCKKETELRKQAEESLGEAKFKIYCKSCLKNNRDILFLPCSHFMYCNECVKEFRPKRCPTCNASIASKLHCILDSE